ncbi:formimidoylglutamase [Vibrio parahaemolyticus]|uniref:formimidoylglutamase n=1 Tax=Vibrio mediterranei TaxID=689 RepID=UPI0040675D41
MSSKSVTEKLNTQHHHVWSGRDDLEDGDRRWRIHHIIEQVDTLSSFTDCVQLLGFETDEGVRRNKGRSGANAGPDIIRAALSNLAWHQSTKLVDLGNTATIANDLENSQLATAKMIETALANGPVVVLGGGHEIAWPSFWGLSNHLKNAQSAPRIGIVNFDAHFDLREYKSDLTELKPSSGTPFSQIADHCHAESLPFEYFCIGISATSNTQALFDKAKRLNVQYIQDTELLSTPFDVQLDKLVAFMERVDYLYLTIDLDVFNAALAPGVSAPAAFGVSLEHFYPLFTAILQQQKLKLADIAEYNPTFDIDNRTAKLAARLCWQMMSAMSESKQ